jgi:hypothetical protein
LAIATPNDARLVFEKQLYNFQRLAATKRRERRKPHKALDAQISTLVTYWASRAVGWILDLGRKV